MVTHTHLSAHCDRPFASLRVTRCAWSNGQGPFVHIEPCLKFIIGPLRSITIHARLLTPGYAIQGYCARNSQSCFPPLLVG